MTVPSAPTYGRVVNSKVYAYDDLVLSRGLCECDFSGECKLKVVILSGVGKYGGQGGANTVLLDVLDVLVSEGNRHPHPVVVLEDLDFHVGAVVLKKHVSLIKHRELVMLIDQSWRVGSKFLTIGNCIVASLFVVEQVASVGGDDANGVLRSTSPKIGRELEK